MSLKRNIKVVGLALIAVFAFSAVTAGAAQANSAPRFTVAGETIGPAVSEPFHATSTGTTLLEVPGLFTLTSSSCTATGNIVGSNAGSPGTNQNVVLRCTGVDVEKFPECVVHSPGEPAGTVATRATKSTLVWLNESGDADVGDTFAPENAENEFVKLEVEKCALAQKVAVKNTAIATIEPVTQDVTTGTLTFVNPPITQYFGNGTPRGSALTDPGLTVGAKAASFTGTFHVTLNSDKLWGVEPG